MAHGRDGQASLLLPNASVLHWIDSKRVLFSEIKNGLQKGLLQRARAEPMPTMFIFQRQAVGRLSHDGFPNFYAFDYPTGRDTGELKPNLFVLDIAMPVLNGKGEGLWSSAFYFCSDFVTGR
jgi:hypothetical protein